MLNIRFSPLQCMVFLAVLFSGASPVRADGNWVLGARGGISWILQKVDGNKDADAGGHLNIHGGYRIAKPLLVGLMLDAERHDVRQGTLKLGDHYTFSVLPFAEARLDLPGMPVVPFANLGIGVNINDLDDDPSFGALNARNKEAYRFGIGADWVFADTAAVTMELAYKINDSSIRSAAASVTSGSYRMNSLALLFGARLIF
ncbi:MAG: outer membrane beta-barrel protein [Deltaproteobacteria bacterium]|nr:outer membrane beta-barrel protein [Deltaproteobacteria bacterium]